MTAALSLRQPLHNPGPIRVAVVHDWLYVLGGAEKVLRSILRCFPDADLFCLFDFLSDSDRTKVGYVKSRTSFLQRMPMIRRRHRQYLPLMPIAIEQFDLRGYELIISSSYAVAKGVLTGPDQLHISYVHSPMRYAWDLQHQYLSESRLERGIKSAIARTLLHRMRLWDSRTAHGVDAYIANSHFIARRIRKTYGRESEVIYPPVMVPPAVPRSTASGSFLVVSRLVPYKNVRVIVEAFRLLPEESLVVVGDGPELSRLRETAGHNVTLTGFLPDDALRIKMRDAEALIFAAEEDFGIVLAEAQGEGTPVIALARGGAREVIVANGPMPTGMFFARPDPDAIADAVRRFRRTSASFTPEACHRNALRFSEERFERDFSSFVLRKWSAFRDGLTEANELQAQRSLETILS
jgi:glycosyltransferase involved in cell wall biosynthesis